MTTTLARPAPPSALRIARARVRLEVRLYFRERQQVVFGFAYPLVMLVIFAAVLGGDERPGGVPFTQYFLAGIAATGIMLTSFQAVGSAVATERETGGLERLQLLGTPPVAYFAGKAGQVLVTAALQLALLLPLAHFAYDVPLPRDAAHWATFLWVAALGAVSGTVLGIAASALPGSATATTTAIANRTAKATEKTTATARPATALEPSRPGASEDVVVTGRSGASGRSGCTPRCR